MTDDDVKKVKDKGNNTVPPDLFEDTSVSIIFHETPLQWGFRGDLYVWKELETYFSNMLLPCSVELFLKELYSAFEHFTGSGLDSKEDIFVPRYDHGGMSTGMVSLGFWSEKALSLLIERLNQANNAHPEMGN